jgi:hypothetical protein
MPKSKPKQAPQKTTPQTTGLGTPRGADLMRSISNFIPIGGPMTGDAEQQKSETGKKARGKGK